MVLDESCCPNSTEPTLQNVCSPKRPYCFSLPERSHINARDPEEERPWCDECDHFEECQEAHRNPPRILTLHLKEVFFRQIQRGEKLREYREFNDYWNKRIQHRTYDVIEICNGYPKRGDLNNRMWFRWNGWQTIMEYHDPVTGVFIQEGMQYFSISLEKPIAYPYQAWRLAFWGRYDIVLCEIECRQERCQAWIPACDIYSTGNPAYNETMQECPAFERDCEVSRPCCAGYCALIHPVRRSI